MQNGYVWNEYIESITKYNTDQIYRQATIDLQQQRELDITNDIYQNLIKRQQNSRLNINGDKISGDVDLTLIGINNQAKKEGIYSFDENAKVKFVAVEDEVTTKMCRSLNNQEFYVHDWNEFERYSENNGRITKYRCYGLVVGLNCPPIDDHFHWCRSTIIYQAPIEKEEKTEYNNIEYVRKNKYTDSKNLDTEIKIALKLLPNRIKNLLTNIKFEKINKGNSKYENNTIYLLKDSDKYEVLHEIGHVIEEKLDIYSDPKFTETLTNNIEDINLLNSEIGNIKGYNEKYEFLKIGTKFVSDYQRRVYNEDMYGNSRINYNNYSFNYNTLRDYFSEGLRYYYMERNVLRRKDIKLYNYIEGILNE